MHSLSIHASEDAETETDSVATAPLRLPSPADISMEGNGSGSKKEGATTAESSSSSMKKKKQTMIHVAMGKDVLDCPVCSTPLKPPIFRCSQGHFVCWPCLVKLPKTETPENGRACRVCSMPVSDRCHGVERVVGSVVVPCSYADHGCTADEITYYDKAKHEASCPHAPCFCPEKASCGGFAGTTEALLDHFVTQHEWAATEFKYYVPFDLPVEEAAGVRPLRAPDGRLFLLVVAFLESSLSRRYGRVSLVSVEPNGRPGPRFGCSLGFSSFEGHYQVTTVDMIASSSLSDGMPTDCLCVVPRVYRGGGGRRVMLRVTIDTEMAHDGDDESEEDDTEMACDEDYESEEDDCSSEEEADD